VIWLKRRIAIYFGGGAKLHYTHLTIFREDRFISTQYYNPPLETFTRKIEPSVIFGVKIGIYSREKKK
jgi:hypothetical protein